MTAARALVAVLWLALAGAAGAQESGTATLPAAARRALAAYGLTGAGLSVYVQELGADQPLLEYNADVPRNPASTQKLLTTFAALEILGPAYTWQTELYALGKRSGDRLEGDLLVKGYGDPNLTTERVWLLLRSLQRQGVRNVAGDLVIDDSYFAP